MKKITFLFLLLLITNYVPAQLLYTSCDLVEESSIVCDFNELDGYTATMAVDNSPGNQPTPLCPDGGTSHNIGWMAFVAQEGNYNITITPFNCTSTAGNDPGVQLGLYTDCTFTESVICNSDCSTNPVSISSSVLSPGSTYYLFIDGCFGSVCKFEIEIAGFIQPPSDFSGSAFIDFDGNGKQNGSEPDLSNVNVTLTPGNYSMLTDEEGLFSFSDIPEGTYTATATINEGEWEENVIDLGEITTGQCENKNIGFIPAEGSLPHVVLSVTNTILRCDMESTFFISIENTSSEAFEGSFTFEFDELTSFVESDIPDLDVNGNVASASTGMLEPFETNVYEIILKMPPGDGSPPLLVFNTKVYEENDFLIGQYEYARNLRCSYDPNDKITYPDREGEENLTLFDEDLEYQIRFQNNGNDTAFVVRIIDELDPNIEPSSVRVVNSSHPVSTSLEGNMLEFLFENIFLVDSTTNFEESQGFVTFRCNVKDGLDEMTTINNTASIIFDTNAPIVTNTTLNTMVSFICNNLETSVDVAICEGESFEGYTESGIYTQTFPLPLGCDSIVTINLEVQEITYTENAADVCEGEAVTINGIVYFIEESQIISDTLYTNDCISEVQNYDITMIPIQYFTIDTTICEGQDFNGLTETGTYTDEAVDVITGCTNSITINLDVLPLTDPACITKANDLVKADIKLYPNPAQSLFYIESDQPLDKVSMFSTSAQKVVQTSIPQGQLKYGISIDDLPKGLYIVQIETKGQTIFKKMVIE